MKRVVAVLTGVLFLVNSSFAADWANPEAKFNAKVNKAETMKVTWQVADNVQAACEKESRRRGNGGFGYAIDACSFWDPGFNSCVIITSTRSSLHDIGHEMRHCFQGNYHP